MPPPVTPSPFRFVGTAGPPSKESTTAGGQYQIPRPTSQDQFARTPRFSFASIRKTELKTLPPAQASSPLSSKARKRSAKIKQLDDVEDSASEGGRENFSNDRGQQEQILLPGEVAEEYEITAEEKPAPRKRTKFSGPLALFSKTTDDPSPTIASPQLALFAARSKEPIYISSSGSSTHGSDGEDKTPQNKSIQSASRTKNRPKSNNAAPHTRFLLPIHTPTKPNKFSHHHLLWSPQRNSRSPRLPHLSFTPHGLAQTMREFIMQTSLAPSYDTTFPSMSEISRPPPESLSFSVSAARLDRSMVTIFAKDMTNDQTLCIVLAGQGQAENGTSRNGEEMKVSPSSHISIRPPLWDIKINGTMCVFAPDWRISTT
ncbi:MAG: hypothetical protein M1829_005560 [Trizodia sp. TS-e1964]|nr:MAG: hypothetical protein M1829_005560 [Trizodia sp. TS-e1964]